MLDSRKRPVAHGAEFWGSKRRKSSSPCSDPERIVQQSPRPSPRSVVALLALTDPTIATHVMAFIPHTGHRKRGETTCVMGTLVSLCRAVAPYDRELPRHFGPGNHAFWQGMVLRCFDFTSRGGATEAVTTPTNIEQPEPSPPRLAVWTKLGVSFVPAEYGFLETLQSSCEGDDAGTWSRKENAFTLFCDLTVLVDKLRGLAKTTPTNATAERFLPCLRRPGAIGATSERPPVPTISEMSDSRTVPFLARVRRSRRDVFMQVITRQLQSWTHFRDRRNDAERIDFYAGPSRRSNRWLGLTSVRPHAT